MNPKQINVLITGGGGFLGSVLVPMLISRGYHVTVLDRFFFGKETLVSCANNTHCKLVEEDSRWFPKNLLRGVDVVIDLAALSNDPIAEIDPSKTLDINFRARVRTATLAKELGVKQYILASSCSIYGFQDGLLKETSSPSPLTTYARASLLAERGVLPLCDKNFAVTVLRQGTLYGISPRMRFDLVINTMTLSAFKYKEINIQGGRQWRPVVHVEDAARAFISIMESDPKKVKGEIFNIGSTQHNFQIRALAVCVVKAINAPINIVQKETPDTRSYRVSCEKIIKRLGYKPLKSPEDGVGEIYKGLRSGQIMDSSMTKTLEWYKKLLTEDPTILEKKFTPIQT